MLSPSWMSWAGSPPAHAPQPNVLFILADDIGYADLGVYGGRLPTPNLDRLAREGMRFTDAHSPAALCAPSRFSMLTGSYPYRSYRAGGAWNVNNPSIFGDPLGHTRAGRQVTVGEILQRAGYRTAFIGKSHLGGEIRDQNGRVIRKLKDIARMDFSKGMGPTFNQHGFDYSCALPSGIQHAPFAFFENGTFLPIDPDKPVDNRSTRQWVNGRYAIGDNGDSEIVEHPEDNPGCGDVDYDSSQVGIRLVSKASDFIDDHLAQNRTHKDTRPFLLYFASQAIHVPHTPPKDFDGDPTEMNHPVEGRTGGRTGDMVYELDLQVGRLLEKLEDTGLTENTLVFFTSDNGALWPRVCAFGVSDHDNNGPFRDYKASVYEGGHRVPFIVKWPGHIEPNAVSDELVLAQDWVATMHELTGQDMEEDQAMDSTSLLPLLKGTRSSGTPLHPFVLYQAGYAYDGAIREGNWVLTVNRENLSEELYDLGSDVGQETNLIRRAVHRDRIHRLHKTFLEYNDHKDATRDPRTTQAFRTSR